MEVRWPLETRSYSGEVQPLRPDVPTVTESGHLTHNMCHYDAIFIGLDFQEKFYKHIQLVCNKHVTNFTNNDF